MASKDLQNLQQAALPLARKPQNVDIPIALIQTQRNFSAAMSLAIQACGLDDKELYLALGIDAGHWSRIRKGEAHFPLDRMSEFCDLIGNRILPEWIAYQVGCQLVMIESEAERLLRHERDAREEAEKQVAMLKSLLVGRVAA